MVKLLWLAFGKCSKSRLYCLHLGIGKAHWYISIRKLAACLTTWKRIRRRITQHFPIKIKWKFYAFHISASNKNLFQVNCRILINHLEQQNWHINSSQYYLNKKKVIKFLFFLQSRFATQCENKTVPESSWTWDEVRRYQINIIQYTVVTDKTNDLIFHSFTQSSRNQLTHFMAMEWFMKTIFKAKTMDIKLSFKISNEGVEKLSN